jgi:hypothetical protein
MLDWLISGAQAATTVIQQTAAEMLEDAFVQVPGPDALFNGYVIKKAAAGEIVLEFGGLFILALVGVVVLTRRRGSVAKVLGIAAVAAGCFGMGSVVGSMSVSRTWFLETVVWQWSEYPLDAQLATVVMILATVAAIVLWARGGLRASRA